MPGTIRNHFPRTVNHHKDNLMSHSLKNNEIISCHTVLLEQMMNEHTLPSEQINYLGKLKFLDM